MTGRAVVQRACADCAAGGAKCSHCQDEERQTIQRSADGRAPAAPTSTAASGGVPESVRSTLLSPGLPLPFGVRRDMESRFGQSFGHVRLHTDTGAARSAADIGAAAYTAGRHLVFGDGRFAPESSRGRRLLAHELAHVAQQRHAALDVDRLSVDTDARGRAEQNADAAADRALAGEPVPALDPARPRVQRKMVEDEAAGGCGICMGPTAAGSIAHRLIQAEFETMFQLYRAAVKPAKKYKGPLESIERDIRGAPGDENGRLDLALESNGELFIGEIKPANSKGLEQGKKDIKFYKDLIKKVYGIEAKPLLWPINLDFVVFPNPGLPNCPREQYLVQNSPSPEGVYTYFCRPTRKQLMMDPNCRCWRRRPKKKKERKPVRVPVPAPQEVPEPVPVPVPSDLEGPVDVGEPGDVPVPETPPVPGTPPDVTPAPDKQPGKTDEPGKQEPGKTDEDETDEGGADVIPFPRPGKEWLPIAAAVAVAAGVTAFVLKQGGKRVLLPVTVAAALILVSQGAEASVGVGGEDPIETLAKNAGKKGINLPPETLDAIKKDPELKRILTEAAQNGNLTEAQQQLGAKLTQTIAENRDQFTDEELQAMLEMTEQVNQAAPASKSDASVEQIKKAIADRKKGGKSGSGQGVGQGSGQGSGGSTTGGPKQTPGNEAGAPTTDAGTPTTAPKGTSPAERLLSSMLVKGGSGGPKFTEETKQKFLAWAQGLQPPLTNEDVDELMKHVAPAEGKSIDEIIATAQEVVKKVREARGKKTAEAVDKVDTPPAPAPDAKKGAADAAQPAEGELVKKRLADFADLKPGQSRPEATWGPEDLNKPVRGFIAERAPNGGLVGGFITLVPLKQISKKQWLVRVPAGNRMYNEAGGFVGTWPTKETETNATMR